MNNLPAFVLEVGGGGFWSCDAVGARACRIEYVRCMIDDILCKIEDEKKKLQGELICIQRATDVVIEVNV